MRFPYLEAALVVHSHLKPEPLGQGLTSKVIETRQPLVVGTWKESMVYGAVRVEDGDETETQSWLGVPILLGDQVTGVISVQDAETICITRPT